MLSTTIVLESWITLSTTIVKLLPIDMLERVQRNVRIRVRQCIDNNGRQLREKQSLHVVVDTI